MQLLQLIPNWNFPTACIPCALPQNALSSCRKLCLRVLNHWQRNLLIAAVAIAVAGCVATFFSGAFLLSTTFFFLAVLSGVNAYDAHHAVALRSLEHLSQGLQVENQALKQSNQDYARLNSHLTQTNLSLQQTSQQLHDTHQEMTVLISCLSLQLTQLTSSTSRIGEELTMLTQENTTLEAHAGRLNACIAQLNQETATSHILFAQVAQHLNVHHQELAHQLRILQQFITDIRAEGRTLEKIRELVAINAQLQQTAAELAQIRLQHGQELIKCQTLATALEQLQAACTAANLDLRGNVDALRTEVDRIRQILLAN